ncbi:MAG: hypothetical protein H6735_10990 [Alphaproteobacteria bacterium]|nr:hypothetical protein [Alphaproteobacteria bacterium]
MGIIHTTLMCHAPIVVPAVGGDRGSDCATTTAAMRTAARRLVAASPDVLVVLSPHTPRLHDAWGVVEGGRVGGDLSAFRAPGAAVSLPAAVDGRERLHQLAPRHGVHLARLRPQPLDHGAIVPMWFVQEAGWHGPTIVIGLPWEEGGAHHLGALLAKAAGTERWAVLASGDMSHRLIPGAPSGYHPRAASFDAAFVERLRAGDLVGAGRVDPALREIAAEDVVTTVQVAAAATDFRADHHQVLAYEGPFGVGYCEAVLFSEAP